MIKYLDLKAINKPYEHAADEVLQSGWYLKGDYTRRFEEAYAGYIGTKHCIGCGNGLDALTLIFRAYIELGVMQEGDEVIVPANTYIASILAITENRLVPVVVEPSWDTLQIDDSKIEAAITPRTRAVMIVHLYGRCAYTSHIGDLCHKYNLKLIEDNAQAHGCLYHGDVYHGDCPLCEQRSEFQGDCPRDTHSAKLKTGSLGDAAGHSFYPTKNLGAFGDAGAVTTNDDELSDIIRALGNYGSAKKYVFDYLGRNSRIDELQAAILLAKLPHLDAANQRRKEIAARYERELSNPLVRLRLVDSENTSRPSLAPRDSVYHIFPVFSPRRDELQRYLADNGVETQIHYPIPPHRQRCYSSLFTPFPTDGRPLELVRLHQQEPVAFHSSLNITEQIHAQELSIPCHQAMTDEDTDRVITLLNTFK